MDKNKFDKIIDDAVKNNNYKNISDVIAQTVDKSIDIARGALRTISDTLSNKNQKALLPAENPKLVDQNPPMLRNSALVKILGIGTSVIMAISSLSLIFAEGASFANILVLFASIPVFIISRSKGKKLKAQGLRLKRYLRELNSSTVITIQDLATAVGEDENFVVSDLQNLIKKDIFKEARIVEKNSIFILDNKTFRIYKDEANRNGKSVYGEDNNEDADKEEANVENRSSDEEIENSLIYFRKLQDLEKQLNEPMKYKIGVLNGTVQKILEFIKKYPESKETCYRFMSYYLPTTVKLLNSYNEYEDIEVKGENINSAIYDIQMSMDTINSAFEKFLDNLYESSTFDTKAELKVMKTVMSRDGLINDKGMKE